MPTVCACTSVSWLYLPFNALFRRRGEARRGRSRQRAWRHVTLRGFNPSADTRGYATSQRIVCSIAVFPVSARSRPRDAERPWQRSTATTRRRYSDLCGARDIAADETSRDRIDAPSWGPSGPQTERGTGTGNGARATPPIIKEAATRCTPSTLTHCSELN